MRNESGRLADLPGTFIARFPQGFGASGFGIRHVYEKPNTLRQTSFRFADHQGSLYATMHRSIFIEEGCILGVSEGLLISRAQSSR
jgi:hypothetical protein